MPSIALLCSITDRRPLSTKAAVPMAPQLQSRNSTSLTDVTRYCGSMYALCQTVAYAHCGHCLEPSQGLSGVESGLSIGWLVNPRRLPPSRVLSRIQGMSVKRSLRRRIGVANNTLLSGCFVPAAIVLGAGWKSPPAVMARNRISPRALAGQDRQGQQIRCDTEADGHSPDGREREDLAKRVARRRLRPVRPDSGP